MGQRPEGDQQGHGLPDRCAISESHERGIAAGRTPKGEGRLDHRQHQGEDKNELADFSNH